MSKYSDFPRNTKEQHIRRCAQQLKEMERAYQEYAPVQVQHAAEMRKAA